MTRQRALRLAREWAQGHVCSLRDGEAEEYHAMFATMLEESMPNEPLTCGGCYWKTHGSFGPCFNCAREKKDNYRRPPEGEEGDVNRG